MSPLRSGEHACTPLLRSGEHGFTPLRRSAEHGFTLVEMLVALTIFGIVAAGGVALLSFGVRAEAAAGARLDTVAALRRMDALLVTDLGQAMPRLTRDAAGVQLVAFTGNYGASGEAALSFVRGGWENPEGRARASLQKVEWRREGDRLERRAWPMLDGAEAGPSVTVLRGVTDFALRYRLEDGEWRDRWDAIRATAMPQLVEATIAIEGRSPLTAIYLVGAGS